MDEAELAEYDIHLPAVRVHYDFRPIRIRVYKNGDENDLGKEITVTRKEFKHWIVFLDALTQKLGATTAVNRLYTVGGIRIDHFEDLQPKGEYVAVERNAFIPCDYGKYRPERVEKKWRSTLHLDEDPPHFLNSAEAMDIYLKHEGYGSSTGLPYPHDSVLVNSSGHSAMHIHSHAHVEQYGGSTEKLNRIGRPVFHEQNGKELSKSDSNLTRNEIHLPKLVGLEDTVPSGKEKSMEELKLPQIVTSDLKSSQESLATAILVPKLEEKKDGTLKTPEPGMGEQPAGEKVDKIAVPGAALKPSVDEIYVEEGHIVVPLKIPTSFVDRSPTVERKRVERENHEPGRMESTLWHQPKLEKEPSSKEKVNLKGTAGMFDADLDVVRPMRRGKGIEQIVERSERRIIKELSDDRGETYQPSQEIVRTTTSYKTYLWEKKRFDPDFD